LKGHGFSRAEEAGKLASALAAEGMQATEETFPQGLIRRNSSIGLICTAETVPFQGAEDSP
jgi:hypothetical protein